MTLLRSRLFVVLLAAAVLSGVSPPPTQAASGDGGSIANKSPPPPGSEAFRQGRKLIREKRFAEALTPLMAAVEAAPGNADYLTELAYANRKAGNRDAAFKYYDQALNADTDHVGAMNYMGMLYIETGRPHKAEELLARIDDECFFTCDEYTTLKKALETGDTSAY